MAQDPKNFKAEEDPERAFYLMSFSHLARDYPATAALTASFMKELAAMSLRQKERDEKALRNVEDDDAPPRQARAR